MRRTNPLTVPVYTWRLDWLYIDTNGMIISDDTTTLENTDFDEDKTQVLSGTERLKYFDDNLSTYFHTTERKKSLFKFLRGLFH